MAGEGGMNGYYRDTSDTNKERGFNRRPCWMEITQLLREVFFFLQSPRNLLKSYLHLNRMRSCSKFLVQVFM